MKYLIKQMGIKGLTKFLKPCIRNINLCDYHGKKQKVIIDVYNVIHSYSNKIRSKGKDILNKSGNNVNHLYAVFDYAILMLRNGIMPIYVFDGKTSKLKHDTLEKRQKIRDTAKETCSTIINKKSSEYIKEYKKSYSIGNKNILECKRLLKALGIKYIESISEADSQCALLSHEPNVIGVSSNDSDMLVFGAQTLLRNLNEENINKISRISRTDMLNYLTKKMNDIRSRYGLTTCNEFTHDNLIDFAILAGTDYGPHIKGLFIDEFFTYFVLNNMSIVCTIDNLRLAPRSDIFIPGDFLEKWIYIRGEYKSALNTTNKNIDLSMSRPDRIDVIKIMCEENNFNSLCVNALLNEFDCAYHFFSSDKTLKYCVNKNTRVRLIQNYNRQNVTVL